MSPDSTAKEKRCAKMLDIWKNELDTVPYIYDISEFSSFLKLSPPPIDDFIDSLNRIGNASKTHIFPTSFKTDLDLMDIISVYKGFPR
jgi:tRNA (guanine26-N2/guanine27-N2)-dimethyltransferase